MTRDGQLIFFAQFLRTGGVLEALPRTHWPTMLRGDCGFGNEAVLLRAEERGLPCLFKLRHTAKVKALVAQAQRAGGAWQGLVVDGR